MKSIQMWGTTFTKCDCDPSLCDGEKCMKDPEHILCDHEYEKKVARYGFSLSLTLAGKIIDMVSSGGQIGSEHVDVAKKIIEFSTVLDKEE